MNVLTGTWTGIPVRQDDKGPYVKIEIIDEKHFPTIGANGFTARRSVLSQCAIGDYLFDIDILYELYTKGVTKFAKVRIGIVHIFSGTFRTFVKKTQRRVKDYLYYSSLGVRKYPWKSLDMKGLLKFVVYSALVFPLVIQAAIGYSRKPDRAWWLHPIFCVATLWIYGWAKITGMFAVKEMDRRGWSQ